MPDRTRPIRKEICLNEQDDIKYFNCSNYNSGRGSCTSTHYIRVDLLEQVVLGEIKRLQSMPCITRTNFSRPLWAAPKRR